MNFNSKLKKNILVIVLATFLLTIVPMSAFASEISKDGSLNQTSTQVASQNVTSGEVETKSIPSAAVKKAIKWAINHMPAIIDDVESVFGKEIAATLEKYSSKVTSALKKLLAYEDVTYNLIQDTVYNALYDYVGNYTATIIAKGVRYAIYYLAPI